MIRIENIKLGYGNKRLFDDITWLIPKRCRVGLVGDNGTGKTTLLKAILGEVVLDSGDISIISKDKDIGYLPQDLIELEPINVLEYLHIKSGIYELEKSVECHGEKLASLNPQSDEYKDVLRKYEDCLDLLSFKDGYNFESNAERILSGFGFREEDFSKNCSEFSGGLKMRILFSSILLSKPDILLLDEPTNHLDTESMEWVESYLKDYTGTIIAVSHDRVFLDRIIDQISELANGRVTLYKGNYTYYLTEKKKRLEIQRKEKKFQEEEIKRIQTFIDRFRYKASKARQVQSRIKMLLKMDIVEIEKEYNKAVIRFPECKRSGYEVLNVENLSKSFEHVVIKKVDLRVHRGDKIAIVGVNGAGKSTLTRLISKKERPDSGEVKYGINVKPAFFSQESAKNLDYHNTIWQEVTSLETSCTEAELRGLLGAFLFSGDEIYKKIDVLSGGEKSRLALLKILLEDSNFLILDEPTNHLDVKTKEIFQNALLHYAGTVLIVSHDRYFLDNLVNRVIEIRDKRCYEYKGNYSYFIEKRSRKDALEDQEITIESESEKETEKLKGYKSREQRKTEARERNQLYRLKQEIKKKLEATEQKIKSLERIRAKNQSLLTDKEVLKNADRSKKLAKDMKTTDKKLKNLYAKWERLSKKLDELETVIG